MKSQPMKKIAITLLALLLVVTLASAQRQEKKVGSFNRVAFRTAGKLYLRQGSPQKVEIEGDQKFIDEELEIKVDGDKLSIGRESNWGFSWNDDNEKITVYITVPNIEGVSVSGSGDLIGENKITTSRLNVSVSGSGTLTLDADVSGDVDANLSGSGKLNLKGKCRDFDSSISGSGKMEVALTIAERANFGVSGSGKVTASGTAQEAKATISGSGRVLAADLVVDRCDVRISGSGGVEINVNKELDANISGSGSVSYKGNPAHVNSHSSGSGSVRKF